MFASASCLRSPAFAGMTSMGSSAGGGEALDQQENQEQELDSSFRWNDDQGQKRTSAQAPKRTRAHAHTRTSAPAHKRTSAQAQPPQAPGRHFTPCIHFLISGLSSSATSAAPR